MAADAVPGRDRPLFRGNARERLASLLLLCSCVGLTTRYYARSKAGPGVELEENPPLPQDRGAWKLQGADGKAVIPESGHNFVLVPPPLLVPRDPVTITLGGSTPDGSPTEQQAAADLPNSQEDLSTVPAPLKESNFVGQGKVLVPAADIDRLKAAMRANKQELRSIKEAMDSVKAEDDRTAERSGEQLGALRGKLEELIKANVDLRKDVWLVHKLPGYAGRQGVPGIDGRNGVSSVIGPGGFSGPPGPQGRNGTTGEPGPRGGKGITGPPGYPGEPGEEGPAGFQGATGIAGVRGAPGKQGRRGVEGPRGREGNFGPPGPVGDPGLNGAWEVVAQAARAARSAVSSVGHVLFGGAHPPVSARASHMHPRRRDAAQEDTRRARLASNVAAARAAMHSKQVARAAHISRAAHGQ